MKYTTVTLMLCFVIPFSMNALAEEKLRVLDKGIDGNQRIYLITCPDGSLSSVVQTFNISTRPKKEKPPEPGTFTGGRSATTPQVTQVCIHPGQTKGEDVCRSSWTIDDAARASCQ